MSDTTLWAELLAYGTGIGLSPIHIAVLLLLLLGPQPLRRGGWFVAGWVVTTMATSALLVTVGHSLVLDMTQGSHHRTGLDLLAGGALIAVGGRELLRSFTDGDTPPAWTASVDRFVNMPQLPTWQELIGLLAFTIGASLLMLTPLIAVAIGREKVVPVLERGKEILFARGELVLAAVSIGIGGYLGWQGISGLTLT